MRQRSQKVISYVRVSTEEQANSGLGLAAQQAAIETEAARRGWTDLLMLSDEGFSAKTLVRPAISQALDMLASGQASTLCVSKLDRLSRSVLDFCQLLALSERQGWSLVVLDLALDTGTPSGRLMAQVMSAFSEYERRLIGQRTSAALQAKKAAGAILGRPRMLPEDVRQRIVDDRAAGMSYSGISRALNADGTPTAQGGVSWYPATVRSILKASDTRQDSAVALAGSR
jgi:DNA invertase Pin-like site-specific DNA recombinase